MIGVVYIAEEQLKRGLYIFVFCLSLGIATMEVPELLSLSDDTTNDVQYLEYLSNRVHKLSRVKLSTSSTAENLPFWDVDVVGV